VTAVLGSLFAFTEPFNTAPEAVTLEAAFVVVVGVAAVVKERTEP
jgi:hypothetical protein